MGVYRRESVGMYKKGQNETRRRLRILYLLPCFNDLRVIAFLGVSSRLGANGIVSG
jgi:hypothetical protein